MSGNIYRVFRFSVVLVCALACLPAPAEAQQAGKSGRSYEALVAACRKKWGTRDTYTQARRHSRAMIRQCVISGGKN